ncbi:MAG: hydrolase 2, exosortase A system-associated [Gammaproteobacteria bacterium]|nr:hydrolase 2, exosortase A system-associated [Gammaproteobacteria bacterium]
MVPRYVDLAGRRLFCLCHAASGPRRRRVLIAPPFAEELNKSRRLLALTARALAARGAEVWLPDLYGTGDSAGDAADARWDDWLADFAALDAQMAAACGDVPAAYLAVRTGALLLAGAPLAGLAGARVLLWQPVLKGARFLEQFLRLKVMAAKLAGQALSQKDLDAELESEGVLEVAGYALARDFVHALRTASLASSAFAGAAAVMVRECNPAEGAQLTMPTAQWLEALVANGVAAQGAVTPCEQFWATQEIAAPTLLVEQAVADLLGAEPDA